MIHPSLAAGGENRVGATGDPVIGIHGGCGYWIDGMGLIVAQSGSGS